VLDTTVMSSPCVLARAYLARPPTCQQCDPSSLTACCSDIIQTTVLCVSLLVLTLIYPAGRLTRHGAVLCFHQQQEPLLLN
jgi:hypothetical protein